MRASNKKQKGISTLIMVLAVGAAMAASLYGAYSHTVASTQSQNTSGARTQARALAQDALSASAQYLNVIFCGSPSGTCTSGNAAGLSATNLPAGTSLFNTGTMAATVVNNTFAGNGEITVDTLGTTPTGAAAIRSYLYAATIYSYTPLNYAFLIKGSQVLTGNVTINTGTTSALMVVGNLGIQGSANITGNAQATGSITDTTGSCTTTATCTSNVDSSTVLSPSIDVYTLSHEANAVFSVDASGQAQVTFQNDPALVPAGTTLLTAFPASSTSLCAAGGATCIGCAAGGATCSGAPSANNGTWTISGTPNPGVLFFYGDVTVNSGTIVAATPPTAPFTTSPASAPGYVTVLATGNVDVATNNNMVAYGQMPYVCDQPSIPTNVCLNGVNATPPSEGSGPVANAVLVSGGSVNYPYTGAGTVYVGGTATTAVPTILATTETVPSTTTQPSGIVTGLFCVSNSQSVGSSGACPSGEPTSGVITGGDITLEGNSNLTGVVAAGESLTAKGTGIITGMIDTANTNNTSTSTLGDSTDSLKGNLTIKYAPGVSNSTNFGGGGQTPELAFAPLWQRYIY